MTKQRTTGTFSDPSVDEGVHGHPHELVDETVFCTSLGGDEIGLVRT